MQVPVLMTSQGQKISTVALNSSTVRPQILPASSSVIGGNTAGKVLLQAVPTLVPAQGRSGERITLQLITLPTVPGKAGTPITLSTLSPVTVPTTNTQVLKLAVPSNTAAPAGSAPFTVLTTQPAMSLQDVTIVKVEASEVTVESSAQTIPTNTQS